MSEKSCLKNCVVNFRLSPQEHRRLEMAAARRGENVSETLRCLVRELPAETGGEFTMADKGPSHRGNFQTA